MPLLELKLPSLFMPNFHNPLRESVWVCIAPSLLSFYHQSLREPGTLEAMRTQTLSILSVFLPGGLHLRALPGHWSDSSMALYSVAKCIESRNNFTLFAKIFSPAVMRLTRSASLFAWFMARVSNASVKYRLVFFFGRVFMNNLDAYRLPSRFAHSPD
jgi:hypothetical protein